MVCREVHTRRCVCTCERVYNPPDRTHSNDSLTSIERGAHMLRYTYTYMHALISGIISLPSRTHFFYMGSDTNGGMAEWRNRGWDEMWRVARRHAGGGESSTFLPRLFNRLAFLCAHFCRGGIAHLNTEEPIKWVMTPLHMQRHNRMNCWGVPVGTNSRGTTRVLRSQRCVRWG